MDVKDILERLRRVSAALDLVDEDVMGGDEDDVAQLSSAQLYARSTC